MTTRQKHLRPARLAALVVIAILATANASAAETTALPAWEQLTDAQREQLVAPVRERWNAEPAERQHMLERATRWRALSPAQRQRAHRGVQRWEHMSVEQRDQARALYSRMCTLEPAARVAFKRSWRAMSAEQKAAWAKANPPSTDKRCDIGHGAHRRDGRK